MELKPKCKVCYENFKWNEEVVIVDDNYYHKDCVNLYPTGYVAFVGDNYIGETENDDGEMALFLLESDELIEED